jgi:hypothetical protein
MCTTLIGPEKALVIAYLWSVFRCLWRETMDMDGRSLAAKEQHN